MAYVDQSAIFTYGAQLTATQMQNLRDNLAAAFAQDIGAPTLADAYIESSMIASMSVGPDHIDSYSILEKNIATNTITSRNLGDDCVFRDQITSGAIGQNELSNSCIRSNHISIGQIGGNNMTTHGITGTHIDSNAITAKNLAPDCVASEHISDSTIGSCHMSASAISQAILNTVLGIETMVDQDADTWTNFELDGGTYGFHPQIKFEASTLNLDVKFFQGSSTVAGDTAYTTRLAVYHNSAAAREVYVQQRYIDACSEVYFIFVLRYKKDKKITRIAFKPNHPAFMSGIDPEKKPHPWGAIYDSKIHELLVIFPSKKLLIEMAELQKHTWGTPVYDLTQVLRKYYEIDTDSKVKWPTKKVTMYVDPVTHEDVKLKIPKPDYIITARLIRKKE